MRRDLQKGCGVVGSNLLRGFNFTSECVNVCYCNINLTN